MCSNFSINPGNFDVTDHFALSTGGEALGEGVMLYCLHLLRTYATIRQKMDFRVVLKTILILHFI